MADQRPNKDEKPLTLEELTELVEARKFCRCPMRIAYLVDRKHGRCMPVEICEPDPVEALLCPLHSKAELVEASQRLFRQECASHLGRGREKEWELVEETE